MTYADLLKWLLIMDEETLQKDVTAFIRELDEFYPVDSLHVSDSTCNVLDANHPYLKV